ncbi:MAG TPA: hypothetical protein VJB63_00295 [Patescibacteria group bacterium]|nr:hypothetical protein [Patescibacteria group bacterium]
MKISKNQIIAIVIIFIIGLFSFGVMFYFRQESGLVFVEGGYGPHINSPLIQNAIKEKKKLTFFLPFDKQMRLSSGEEVSIVVPSEKYQHNAWTLTVQIFGIEYERASDDPEYETEKRSFLEASRMVFDWMRSHGVDYKKLIINWGDKAFIQERAEQWLNE